MGSDAPPCHIRTRKFKGNPLLSRRQMIVDVIHPGRANVSKKDLRVLIAKMYKVADDAVVSLFGFRTAFGGGKSSGFCLIYDNISAMNKYEPKYRLNRLKETKTEKPSRKQRKERKNRAKKIRGTKKNKPQTKSKGE